MDSRQFGLVCVVMTELLNTSWPYVNDTTCNWKESQRPESGFFPLSRYLLFISFRNSLPCRGDLSFVQKHKRKKRELYFRTNCKWKTCNFPLSLCTCVQFVVLNKQSNACKNAQKNSTMKRQVLRYTRSSDENVTSTMMLLRHVVKFNHSYFVLQERSV